MTEPNNELIYKLLQDIQKDQRRILNELHDMRTTMATRGLLEGVASDLNYRVSGVYDLLLDIQSSLSGHGDRADGLELRIKRIEDRTGLNHPQI